jgi:hypothetical protein
MQVASRLQMTRLKDLCGMRHATRLWRRALSGERGQALVELALVTPLLLVLILGTVEVVGAFNAYISVIGAAREGARLVARGNVFSDSDVALVVEQHSHSIDIVGSGTVVAHRVEFDSSGAVKSYSCATLVGSASPRLSEGALTSMHTAAAGGLLKEKMAVVEIIYEYQTITGVIDLLPIFPSGKIPLYSYAIMPVSAPS